jgi:thymidylate synthase
MNIEDQYLDLVKNILQNGKIKQNRTEIPAYTIAHTMLQHDMNNGFPLLTTKRMHPNSIFVELQGFINGEIDKKWYQDRGCSIWDEWCNPAPLPKDISIKERKKLQFEARDLGPIYGYQWRNFNSQGFDQLQNVLNILNNDPQSRRMLVSAWNPAQMEFMALPPCHVLWHVTVIEDTLNLCWFQRSCDVGLGIPYNIASYAMLLKLLALESGLKEGILTGFLSDVHIYQNHVEKLEKQIKRSTYALPDIKINNFTNIYDWKAADVVVENYIHHKGLIMEVAI